MATLDFSTARPQDAAGIRKRRIVRLVGPTTYGDGDPFVAGDVQLGTIECVAGSDSFLAWNGSSARLVVYDRINNKFRWYLPAGSEVAGASDLSGFSARIEVIGF
jgi:hypothetical protein